MDNGLIKNRLQERRQSSEILVERTIPPVIEQNTKIFVVGPPRSGTTLVYSRIANELFLPECTFVSSLMKAFDETYRFSDKERFNYYGHTQANLAEIYKKPIYDFLYTAALKVGGVSTNRFIYKDPSLTLYLEYFPLFFDDSYKIVFCVRDPRDVVASMFRVLKDIHSDSDPNALFDQAINFIFPFFKKIYDLDHKADSTGRDKIMIVKYEDLVTGTVEMIQDLETFLGMTIHLHGINEYIKGRLDETSPFYSENYGKPITTDRIGRYKELLTSAQISKIERVFSYYMLNLHYQWSGGSDSGS